MKCACNQEPPMTLCMLHSHELRRRMALATQTIESQRALLTEALDALLWCSGASDFQPGQEGRLETQPGPARQGWLVGPAVTILKLKEALK